MSQGLALDRAKIIEALRPYFQLGCNVRKACAYAGVSESTFSTWLSEGKEGAEELRIQIGAWQNEISAKARINWREEVANKSFDASKQWLERKEKDEFSTRTESTGADGKSVSEVSLSDEQLKRILANNYDQTKNESNGNETSSPESAPKTADASTDSVE